MPGAALKSAATEDVRLIGGNINGRYTLFERGAVRAFACRIQSVTPRQMALAAPVAGAVGETIALHFEPFGLMRGQIVRRHDFGFVVDLVADEEERGRIAARIRWLKKHVTQEAPEYRAHRRVPPREPRSTLVLADGRALDCFIIDMSPAGVAVSADLNPRIGEPLAVGRAVGRVVRHLEVGFAVQFRTPLEADSLDMMLQRIV